MTEPPASYRVLARRFRPVEFADVVGQEHVLATLRGGLEEDRLPHALLFSGSRGVGKTTTARILARAVNCEVSPGPQPCGTCEACTSILDGSASDVVELDAASNNGVDEVRALRDQAGYAPIRLRKKVFVLDEVHMFSRSAFNALLKILEEPPAQVLFILATTEAHKVPDTVLSRCQVLPFRRIQEADIRARLEMIASREGITAAPEVLAEIATTAMGGLRDAETALERILPVADGLDLEGYRRIVGRLGPSRAAEVIAACLDGDARAALAFAGEAVETGVDERECLGEVLDVLRHVFLLLVDGPDTVLVEASGAWRGTLNELAAKTDIVHVDAMMQIVVLARDRIRQMDDRRVILELTLVRLARCAELVSLGEVASQEPAEPSAPPRPSAASTDPWVQTVAAALEQRAALGQLLERASLAWDGPNRLQLAFGVLKPIERMLVTSEASTTWLAEVLARHAGRPVEVAIEIADEVAAAPDAPAKPAKERWTGASVEELPPIGRKAAELFDVHHVEREDDERS